MASLEHLDPFLIAHRVGGGEFDMAGKYSPAAVRDQMNRAVAIVERAIRVGLLDATHRLLIRGGGAAGVSAAMQAVKLGVGRVAISRQDSFFDRQRRSNRILDPVEYDWPAEGWESGATPSTRVPLPYSRGRAKQIVIRQWEPAWAEFRSVYEGQRLQVLDSASEAAGAKFDRVLDCTGPGDERTQVGDYHWYPFWSDDMLEIPSLDFENTRPLVLISGGGDGALQDFLRILFPGKTPRDIYLGLELSAAQRLGVEWSILNAEDRARRAWIWSADPEIDCGILAELHEAHRRAAVALLPVVSPRLATLLRQSSTDPDRLWLAHGCTHFSPCYAFNRFLVVLVDEYFKRSVGTRLLSGRRLERLSSEDGHVCDGEIETCLPHRHRPHFSAQFCLGVKQAAADAVEESEAFDLIVVRHGLIGQTKRLSRQALPYELPRMP